MRGPGSLWKARSRWTWSTRRALQGGPFLRPEPFSPGWGPARTQKAAAQGPEARAATAKRVSAEGGRQSERAERAPSGEDGGLFWCVFGAGRRGRCGRLHPRPGAGAAGGEPRGGDGQVRRGLGTAGGPAAASRGPGRAPWCRRVPFSPGAGRTSVPLLPLGCLPRRRPARPPGDPRPRKRCGGGALGLPPVWRGSGAREPCPARAGSVLGSAWAGLSRTWPSCLCPVFPGLSGSKSPRHTSDIYLLLNAVIATLMLNTESCSSAYTLAQHTFGKLLCYLFAVWSSPLFQTVIRGGLFNPKVVIFPSSLSSFLNPQFYEAGISVIHTKGGEFM